MNKSLPDLMKFIITPTVKIVPLKKLKNSIGLTGRAKQRTENPCVAGSLC